jgi:glycogen operon protein
MLLGGDEIGRTQGGNNNAYCQDNPVSWYDWERADQALLEFTRQLIAFRHAHPVFRRRGWFKGRPIKGKRAVDIAWFKPDGLEMTEQDWSEWFAKSFSVFLNGDLLRTRDDAGRKIRDDSFLLLFNAHTDTVSFTLPDGVWSGRWRVVIDTVEPTSFVTDVRDLLAGDEISRPGLSLLVLRRV